MSDFLTPRLIVRETGWSPQQLYQWLWSGVLPGTQDERGNWRVTRADLKKFLAEHPPRKREVSA
jgi:hypothetical protein